MKHPNSPNTLMQPNALSRYEKRNHRWALALGSLAGAGLAVVLAVGVNTRPRVIQPLSPPSWSVQFENKSATVVEANEIVPVEVEQETIVAEQKPLALEHQEPDTDFLAMAADLRAQGKGREAMKALRHHLWNHEPDREVLFELGELARALGDFALSEQALLDAGALDPASPAVQVELARTLLEAGEPDRAREAVRQALRLDRESAPAWFLAGRIAMNGSEWDRAEGNFLKALELDPTNAAFYNNLGLLYLYMKRGEPAVDALETALELYGDEAPHYVINNLGLAHELLGQWEEAREAFAQTLVRNPFYARAKVNLKRVEKALTEQIEKEAQKTAQKPETLDSLMPPVTPEEG